MEKNGSARATAVAVAKSDEIISELAPAEAEVKAASMIVVLAKNASSVRSTVLFLERRGFAAKILSSLNEAVELFAKKEADKLLLSVNFPHPKVEMLPVLMNQSFQIQTILFAEDNDRKSQSRLDSAKTKHVLFGPVSGPVAMMKIRQIDREASGGVDDQSASGSTHFGSESRDEADIKIGGRLATRVNSFATNVRSEGERKAALDQFMRGLNDDEAASQVSFASDLQRAGDTIVQKGQRSKMKSETQKGIDADDRKAITESALAMRQGIDRGLTAAPIGGPIGGPRRRLIASNQMPKRGLTFTNADGVPTEAAVASDDKIERCLREALATVAGRPTEQLKKLAKNKYAALFSLRSAKLNYAFVVSLNYAKQTPAELFHGIEIAFCSLLLDNGVEFENNETHLILLDNMTIVETAFGASEFTIVTRTAEIEMGVAKVYAKNPIPAMMPYEENMLSVSLRDLPTDEPVAFSVYLHFERNKKYVRYLKFGSSISEPQLGRLEKRHPKVLVEQGEGEAYRRHYAAHSIQPRRRRSA